LDFPLQLLSHTPQNQQLPPGLKTRPAPTE
jgi:hypothetical protein